MFLASGGIRHRGDYRNSQVSVVFMICFLDNLGGPWNVGAFPRRRSSLYNLGQPEKRLIYQKIVVE